MTWTWGPDPVMRSLIAEGIEPEEALWVLSHDPRWPRPGLDPVTGVWSLTIWGRTSADRAILVAARPIGGRDWEIVGARHLTAASRQSWSYGRPSVAEDLTEGLRSLLPLDVHRLEFLPPGESGPFDIGSLPALDAPVVASHTIMVSTDTEQVLQAQAAALGVSVEELIVARIQNAA